MSKQIIFSALLIMSNCVIIGQNKVLDLQIENSKVTNDGISFNLVITNVSDTPIRTYLPQKRDICNSLLKINCINVYTGQSRDLVFCGYIDDLDCIILDSLNTVLLTPKESFEQYFYFPNRDLYIKRKRKKKDIYQISVEWRLKDVSFKGLFENVFRDTVESNKIEILL